GLLRPGMTVRARLVKERFKDAIVVPQDAVLNGDQGASVFLEQDGLAVERPVVVSTVSDEMAVIESGLGVGDRLITRGARDLVNGERVEVLAN
ncbi:MAG: efflux RND transporter periplasmic adaptor subunit, partial [Gemmatimonadetes bacterium]|nr:efflux RND transporter periplasmic adaptor subunit [Gemmatimonadota bacterium]